MEKLLTPEEVAKTLKIGVATVYRYAKLGSLSPIKTADGIRFGVVEIQRKIGRFGGVPVAETSRNRDKQDTK